MSSSLNNNIYTSIDIRFQNYPSSLIKKAIKRQGFILDELMQREIKTFYPTKEEMPSNDAMINQAANIEKIIQLKASHYEKRRLEKIDAVLYESKLLLQNPNLQPHRHLAAADSHKIINGGNSPSISDAINSNKSLNRHISSSYLSAGYSAVTYLKEKRPEDGGDDKKNYNDNNQGMIVLKSYIDRCIYIII